MGDTDTLTRERGPHRQRHPKPPRRNALSEGMLTEVAAAFAGLRDDAMARVVTMTLPVRT